MPSVMVEDPATLEHLSLSLSYFLTWADAPLWLTGKDTEPHPWVASHAAQVVVVGLGLFDRLQLAIALPYVIYEACGTVDAGDAAQDGSSTVCRAERDGLLPPRSVGGSGFNDFVFTVKGNIFDNRRSGFGLSLAVDATLPIDSGGAFRGYNNLPSELDETTRDAGANDPQVTVTPRVMLGYATSKLRAALNLGVRFQRQFTYLPEDDRLRVGHELLYGLGGSYSFGHGIAALAEFWGATLADFSGSISESPLEALLGVRWSTPLPGLALSAGAGLGLLRGYGAARSRIVVGLSYALSFRRKDRDGDGIADDRDACVDRREDVDGFLDDDGCPDPDNDGDGIADSVDECPYLHGPHPSGCPAQNHQPAK